MYMMLDEFSFCEMVSLETATAPHGNSCATSVLQSCSRTKKLDSSSAIRSRRSYGKPIKPFRSNSLAPGSFGDPPRPRGVVGDDASS